MKFRNLMLVAAAVLFCTASISATTWYHTYVSGNGSDSNPCTFTSPCATFQAALANTVDGGMITAKDASDFWPVVINQSVTIDGANMGSITSEGTGINITSGANVTVQNLTINGLGIGNYGISANGGIVTVKNCDIMNIANQGDGIFFGGPGYLTVEDSRIETFIGNGVFGIEIGSVGQVKVVVRNTVIDAAPLTNGNSGFVVDQGTELPVMASLQNVTIRGAGLNAVVVKDGTTQITGSVITQSAVGVSTLDGATASVASSLITDNQTGVCSGASSKIRLDNNDIYDNVTAISDCGGIVKTSTTNKTSGIISIPASDVSDSVTF